MSDLQVSDDFIQESKNICQHRPKTSPHTKSERKSRRDEVFKLHFEYGYSARKISQMMNINRNTINSDVSFWYSKLRVDNDKNSHDDWLNKQLLRLETQRVRLRKELDSDITLQEKLQIEKMILDLDSKISSLIIKLESSRHTIHDFAVGFINNWMEEKGYKDRFMLSDDLYRIPAKAKDKIFELLKNR